MGLDFIRNCAPSWERTWDRGREELSQVTLFSGVANPTQLTFRARMDDANTAIPRVGQQLVVRLADGLVEVVIELAVVAHGVSPSAEIIELLETSGCSALGAVADRYETSRTFDVALQ